MADIRTLVGKIVSFSLYAPSVIGSGYTNVKVLGITTASIAKTFNDIVSQHAQVYPSLPVGTVNNYQAYDYVLIENANKKTVAIGIPWIQNEPTESASSIVTFTYTNLSASQIKELEFINRSNNYTDFSVKVTPV